MPDGIKPMTFRPNNLPPKTQKELERTLETVEKTQVPIKTILFSGRVYQVSAHVKNGPTYIDMEELRKALNLSERRFEFALRRAQKRRAPTVTIEVQEK